MCFVSVVMTQWEPHIPRPNQWPPPTIGQQTITPVPWPTDPVKMREFIAAFRAAVKAAEVFDEMTGQPDCVDPEKATLEDRVAELERKLAATT